MDKYIKCIFLVNNQCIKLSLLINNTLLYIFSPPKWIPRFFFSWSIVFLVSLFVTTLVFVELPVSLCIDLMIGTQVVVPIHSTVGRSQMWVIHSGELAKLVPVAILRAHLCEKYYHHRHYEHDVQGLFRNSWQH